MTTTVAQLADTLQTLFTTTADQLAADTGLVRRRRKLSGARFAQGLVFTWLDNPRATLGDLAVAAAPDGAGLAPQSPEARFTPGPPSSSAACCWRPSPTSSPPSPPPSPGGAASAASTCWTAPAWRCRRRWPPCGPAAAAAATTAPAARR